MEGNWSLWQAGVLEEAECELPTLCYEATGGRKNTPYFQLAQAAVLACWKYSKSAAWQPHANLK